MSLKKENADVVLKFVKKHLGAEGVTIIASESRIPCEHKRGESEGECEHEIALLGDGISRKMLPGLMNKIERAREEGGNDYEEF